MSSNRIRRERKNRNSRKGHGSMRTIQVFSEGDKVNVEMIVGKRYVENGEDYYILHDPRRMNKQGFDYPFTADQLTLKEEAKTEERESKDET